MQRIILSSLVVLYLAVFGLLVYKWELVRQMPVVYAPAEPEHAIKGGKVDPKVEALPVHDRLAELDAQLDQRIAELSVAEIRGVMFELTVEQLLRGAPIDAVLAQQEKVYNEILANPPGQAGPARDKAHLTFIEARRQYLEEMAKFLLASPKKTAITFNP